MDPKKTYGKKDQKVQGIRCKDIQNRSNLPIVALNPIPKHEKFSFVIDELESVKPIILNGNLGLIK